MKNEVATKSILVEYFRSLVKDPETPLPTELGDLQPSSLDFEINQLNKYICDNMQCRNPFLMDDVDEAEVLKHFDSEDEDIRVSAVLTIIKLRVPYLPLEAYV